MNTEVKNELLQSIDDVTNAVEAINATQAGIAELRKKYEKVIFEVETPKGMKAAREARQEIRAPRFTIEKLRKEAKAPILALGRQLDAKAKELTAEVLALETPVDEQIKEVEARLEREREAKVQAELARVETIQEHISDIRKWLEFCTRYDTTAEAIAVQITDLEELAITDELFQEFRLQALETKAAVLQQLRDAHTAAVTREDEKRKAAAAQAELEQLRAAEVARQEEDRKIREAALAVAEEKRKAAEAAEKKKREAEEAKRRAELEAAQKKQAEEQARIDAENKRLADERAEFERQQEAAREREREAERTRQAETAAEQKRREKAAADAKKAKFPGEAAIVEAIAEHFDVTAEVARKWLSELRKRKAA